MTFESASKRGVQVHYGPRSTGTKFGSEYTSDGGRVKTAEWVFSYDGLPTPGTGNIQHVIPAYAKILDARIEVLVAFAGGTSYDIGLAQADDTEIDNDGLFDGVVTASLNARGKTVRGNGVLVPNQYVAGGAGDPANDPLLPVAVSIGSAAGELKAVATGTFTAGKAKLTVKYLVEGPTGL